MKRMVLTLLLPLALAPVGCDREDDGDVAEQARLADDAEGHAGFAHHAPIDKLCALVSCTDEQREAIAALVPAPTKRERPDAAKLDAANAALADAFRSEGFSTAAIAAWRDAVHKNGERPRPSAETIVGIHGILDATQRDTLADVLEARGPGALLGMGKGGTHKGGKRKGGKHEDKAGRGKKGDRGERFVAELCERIDCHDDQAQAIATALASAKRAPEREADADAAFAEAFRKDALDVRTVSTYLAGLAAIHEREAKERDAALVTIHGVLDAEQRSVLADEIADHGLRALMPARRHHGRRGPHGPADTRPEAPA